MGEGEKDFIDFCLNKKNARAGLLGKSEARERQI